MLHQPLPDVTFLGPTSRRCCCAGMMARNLDLQRGGKRFIKTAAYGHFGRDDPDFTWEKVSHSSWLADPCAW